MPLTSWEAAFGEPRIGLTSRTNYDLLGVPIEEACLQEYPGWHGCYDLRL